MKKYFLGVDLGGTKILTGLADFKGKILEQIQTPTPKNKNAVIRQIIDSLKYLVEKNKVSKKFISAIGVGAPGPIIQNKGIIIDPPNLPGWRKVPLKQIIEKELKIKTILENDANAAALGELAFGAGWGYTNLIYITISTGVGGGIILNGKIFHGSHGCAGEIGHTVVEPQGAKCGCGKFGCLEAVASGTAMAKLTGLKDALEVEKAARAGNQKAQTVIQQAALYIGIALANVVTLFNPEIILIGGGVANMGALLLNPIKNSIKKNTLKVCQQNLKVRPAKLGKLAGLKGAIALCLKS